jgi:hypothetical protein
MVAVASTATGDLTEALPTKDKVIIGFLGFFILIGCTLELYWLMFNNHMLERNDILKTMLSWYWICDRTYRDPGMDNAKAFTFAVESLNTACKVLDAALIYAIVKRKPWRHGLQCILATCFGYGTVLYYYVAHLTDYNVFTERTPAAFAMFVFANIPWLNGYGYMAFDSARAMTRAARAGAV